MIKALIRMTGKTIGVYERAAENIRRLQAFLDLNGIDCTIRYFTKDQMVDGNLYQCLEDREVDMLLGNNTDAMERFRVVAEFDSQPYYIVTTPDNQEILDAIVDRVTAHGGGAVLDIGFGTGTLRLPRQPISEGVKAQLDELLGKADFA